MLTSSTILVYNIKSKPKRLTKKRQEKLCVKRFSGGIVESKFIGVITGDLYKSTAGYDRGLSYQNIMESLKKEFYLKKRYSFGKIEYFRGDSFQISISDPSYIIEVAAYIRAYLLSLTDDDDNKYDARMSLNISRLNKYTNQNETYFEKAFVVSGRNLDNMQKNKRFIFNSDVTALDLSLNASILLLDSLMSMMSKPQAEVFKLCIDLGMVDTVRISRELKKSRQNIHKLISRAGIDNLLEYLRLSKQEIEYHLKGSN